MRNIKFINCNLEKSDEDDSNYDNSSELSSDYSSDSDYSYTYDDDLNDLDYKTYNTKNKLKESSKSSKKRKRNIKTEKKRIRRKLNKDKYFKILSKKNKIKIIDIEFDLFNFNKQIIPNRYKILQMNTSIANKSIILKKVDIYNNMYKDSNEYNKLSKWINGISMIPFGIYIKPNIVKEMNQNKIQEYINNCYNELDKVIYGQYNVKNKIMQIVSQSIINPLSNINIIALQGPPGVGKTSLVKNGLSKILNKPFYMIALGGCNDSSTLEGHNYTYEGSSWGKLLNILMQSQCMNPIIYFDELDKISNTPRGKEIVGILTHLTDPIQNQNFMDKYYEGINIDFSKVFFIFSFNNINFIDPILKDRLTIIQYDSYKISDKIIIAQKYLLPNILKNLGNSLNQFIINDKIIDYIIKNYIIKEEGVRNLNKCIQDIIMKFNLLTFINIKKNKIKFPYNINDLNKIINIPIQFPITLTKNIIDIILKKNKNKLPISIQNMYL